MSFWKIVFGASIHDAASDGDLKRVKWLLRWNRRLVNARGWNGNTPLHNAALGGHQAVAELLLAYKADVNAKNQNGLKAFEYAAPMKHSGQVVDFLRLYGVHPVFHEIHDPPRDADFEKVEALLKGNPELVFKKDNDGKTPLHRAAKVGAKDVAKLLLANKANVNAEDDDGHTPLHTASNCGRRGVAELLLAHKAEVNAKDIHGRTPLHYAAEWDTRDMVELLLASKADVNAKDACGTTPMSVAAEYGRQVIVVLLRQHGGH